MIVKKMIIMIMAQVVNFIRAAREPHSGSLVLAVRQVAMMPVYISLNILFPECVPG